MALKRKTAKAADKAVTAPTVESAPDETATAEAVEETPAVETKPTYSPQAGDDVDPEWL